MDRKARGGYVVAVYDLVPTSAVKVPLPVPFHGTTRIEIDEEHPYGGDPDDWLADRSGNTPSPAVTLALQSAFTEGQHFIGHANMLRLQTWLVHLGREGHGGVPEVLQKAQAAWLNSPHASEEDPRREWRVALATAITKFGGDNQ